MSGHSVSAIALFLSVAAIALAASHTDNQASALRNPAMVRKELALAEKPAPTGPRHTEKIRGPMTSRIELIGAAPEKVGDVFVLKGVVESEELVKDLEFKWSVPSGLEVVSGVAAGTISLVDMKQSAEVQITLRNLTPENRQVHLIVKGALKSIRFGDSVQYNTVVQPLLDAQKEETLRANEKATEEREKVFQ